jgi:hypothetical protein
MLLSRTRHLLLTIVSSILLLIVLELIAMTAFRVFRDRFTFYSADRYTLSGEEAELYSPFFDAKLGWSDHFDTPFSERKRLKEFGRPLISSYGDSYIYCTDVEDDETWQYYLSAILEADVYNFGTGGYGTDQAYLKYLETVPRLKTGIIVIGLTPENINRIVNVYRPFYFQKTGIKLPKPRFLLEDGRLKLLENPLGDRTEIVQLTDRDFVMSLGRNDWWFNRDRHPVLGFPYLRILFNRRIWLEAFHGRTKGGLVDDTIPRPWENLWENEEVRGLMNAILKDWIGDIRSRGSIPVVMISALQPDVFHKFMTGTDPAPVWRIKEFCSSEDCLCFDAVDALAGSVTKMEEIPRLYNIHVSAAGNMIIAERFALFLEEKGLASPARRD